MSGGGNVFKGKQEYFYDLGEYGELWDNELDGLMNFLQKHLKVEPDDILVMDNQGEMEWQLDAKLKRVPNSQWAPGIKTLDSAEVKSAPGIVTFTAGPFHAVYFTKNSEKSFASIQFANEMSGGGKTEGNKWIKWSKSQVDAENGEDYDVTLYDVWVNPKDGEQFYKIEKIDQEDEYVVMGELGDMGEELIEEYSTLAKARARAKELVRIAESK